MFKRVTDGVSFYWSLHSCLLSLYRRFLYGYLIFESRSLKRHEKGQKWNAKQMAAYHKIRSYFWTQKRLSFNII
nr:MAG TPA: hypothetical protein [Caudoviricetes sp.]